MLETWLARREYGALVLTDYGRAQMMETDRAVSEILAREMNNPSPRPSLEQLIAESRASVPMSDAGLLAYFVAMKILTGFLGLEWMEKYVMGKTAPTDFLKNDASTVERVGMHKIRVIHLAEMLYNLRIVQGFRKIVEMIKGGDIEAAFAELEVSRLVLLSGRPFRFVEPTGTRGENYDLEILFGKEKACADTKCKLETTEADDATIYGALHDARDQLPKNEPGIFFVKLPQTWNPGGMNLHTDAMERAANKFWRNTGRIVSVKFYFSLALEIPEGTAPVLIIKEFINPNRRFDRDINWNMFDEITLPGSIEAKPIKNWADLIKMCM
jgi:hypothetical protein